MKSGPTGSGRLGLSRFLSEHHHFYCLAMLGISWHRPPQCCEHVGLQELLIRCTRASPDTGGRVSRLSRLDWWSTAVYQSIEWGQHVNVCQRKQRLWPANMGWTSPFFTVDSGWYIGWFLWWVVAASVVEGCWLIFVICQLCMVVCCLAW